MPNCVVKGCKNQSSKNKKQDGITFHTFPNRDQNMKEKWIAVIRDSRNQPLWHPTSRSVVCSAHFNSEDLYYTKKGLRRVIRKGYPKSLPGISEQLDNEDLSYHPPDDYLPAAPDLSNDPILSHPITIYAVESAVTIQQYSDVNQPSATCTVQPDLSEHKLRKRIIILETKLKSNIKKLKNLNKKVGHLQLRNRSLREILVRFEIGR